MEIEIKRTYYKNAQLWTEFSCIGNKLEGLQKMYHQNGRLAHKYYLKNGKYLGINQSWYIDGTMCDIAHWENNQINGPKILFKYK